MEVVSTRSRLPLLALFAAVSAWIWPIGIGGKMPVGGDVTNFSIGLMACLSRAIRAGHLPLWNDLWGFGFPGLAESQMGVYYPPHLVLYGLFSTETAYAVNLAIHSYWAALGAYWMARKFGVTSWGAALSGFVFAACGTSMIHLVHHWSYTTASWMPWAWGLAHRTAGRDGTGRSAGLLAALLAIQILPGHFQFAFMTQVGVLTIAGGMGRWRGALRVILAMVAIGPLAAMQLWPTWQLARSAESLRDFDYLSAFASPPPLLVSLVAPNLFHESPLWRSVAWDPFHAMPEEHRLYVGLVPLWLALGAIFRGFRKDGPTRLLTVLAGLTLLLSLGPYVPGFSLLIRLPGFSFFRAPARWGMATSLALAVLAGKGFDSWTSWPRRGRAVVGFALIAILTVGSVVALFELALAATEGTGIPWMAASFEKGRRILPWPPEKSPSFRRIMAGARSSPVDPLVLSALLREGIDPGKARHLRLDRKRFSIYRRELGETAILILIFAGAAPLLARWSQAGSAFLFLLTVADLLMLSRHRQFDLAPLRPLTEQSPVLGRLAAGSRTMDNLRNLPMIGGAAPVLAYRTLDRPAMISMTRLADRNPSPKVVDALRILGVSSRIFDPFERIDEKDVEPINDPTLAGWLYGQAWIESPEGKKATTFRLWKPGKDPSVAWFLPDRHRGMGDFPTGLDDPERILEILDRADPLPTNFPFPERFETRVVADGPGFVILSILDDPEWEVRLIGPGGERSRSTIPIFPIKDGGAWQSIPIPSAGTWKIVLEYRGRAAKTGLMVSSAAWLAWVVFVVWPRRRKDGITA